MKVYRIISILLLLTGFVLNMGCSKQLDENLKRSLTPVNYFNSEQDAIQAVNALYGSYRDNFLYGQELRFILMWGNDEVLSNTDATVSNWIQENYTMNPTNLDRVRLVWGLLWEEVKNANFVIDGASAMDTTSGLVHGPIVRRVIAEAKFLRALTYLHLTSIWGDLPILNESYQTIAESTSIPKSSRDEIIRFISEDLIDAAKNLPLKKDYAAEDIGRASHSAALALLMKVQLWQKDWKGVVTSAERIVQDPSRYALNPDMNKNFESGSENGVESIFEIQYAKNIAQNHLGDDYAAYPPTKKLINAYEAIDIRKGLYITDVSYREPIPTGRYYFRKYGWDPTEPYTAFNQGVNFVVLRFADVLLMYAEALNELNRTSEAVVQINKIRDRAHATPISTDISQNEFRKAIMKERMLELCGECWRRFDLIRWGTLVSTVKSLSNENPMGAANISEKNLVYPIPAEEIELNPNLLPNNGY